MTPFTSLLAELDAAARPAERIAAMAAYFREASPADAAWAVQLLKGDRPRRTVSARQLAGWAMAHTETPAWLFDECRAAVGDIAETAALLMPDPPQRTAAPLHRWIEQRLLPLAGWDPAVQQQAVTAAWQELDAWQRYVWNRLLTGTFRSPATRAQLVRALAQCTGTDRVTLAHRIDAWEPTAQAYTALGDDVGDDTHARPYPFVAWREHGDRPPELDAPVHAVWLWGGIRAQLLRRRGRTFLWTHAGELVNDRCPELADAAAMLPDGTVVEGEIVAWQDDAPLPAAQLERRMRARRPGSRLLAEVPLVLMVHQVLERGGVEQRDPQAAAVAPVAGVTGTGSLRAAPHSVLGSGAAVADACSRIRDAHASALLLLTRPPTLLRPAALALPMVLMYAARDDDYTFGVWQGEDLVPVTKTRAGLDPAQLRRLENWARRNTVEKFGPVRSLKPVHVFDVAFDEVQPSPRHRSGVVLTGARVAAWRTDLQPQHAAGIDEVHALLMSRPQ